MRSSCWVCPKFLQVPDTAWELVAQSAAPVLQLVLDRPLGLTKRLSCKNLSHTPLKGLDTLGIPG